MEHDTPTKSMETGFWQILILARGGTQGPHPLFMLIQQSPHRRLAPGDQSKRTDLRPRRACGSPISGQRNEPRRCNAAASVHLRVLLCPPPCLLAMQRCKLCRLVGDNAAAPPLRKSLPHHTTSTLMPSATPSPEQWHSHARPRHSRAEVSHPHRRPRAGGEEALPLPVPTRAMPSHALWRWRGRGRHLREARRQLI
jgi:hypothetical protein